MDDFDISKTALTLIHLRQEHRDLDAAIEQLRNSESLDELAIKRMKKRKLMLKDTITRLESDIIPDEPA